MFQTFEIKKRLRKNANKIGCLLSKIEKMLNIVNLLMSIILFLKMKKYILLFLATGQLVSQKS